MSHPHDVEDSLFFTFFYMHVGSLAQTREPPFINKEEKVCTSILKAQGKVSRYISVSNGRH
jgi:hypothetical protein